MSSGKTAQDPAWKSKEEAEEICYVKQKEKAQLEAIRHNLEEKQNSSTAEADRNFEGGFGGQEDLEDRYATTCGEH